MSKVALMTWFQYHNYGTALQASALAQTISSLGHQVDVIDYHTQGRVVTAPDRHPTKALLARAMRKIRALGSDNEFRSENRGTLFEHYLHDTLTFTDRCETMADLEALNEGYDVFVCGSDQIWSPTSFDPHYFLDFAGDGRLKVAYAPSVGLPEVRDADVAHGMGKLASRIDCLSTREVSGSKIISGLTGREVATVLDPTLLVGADKWAKVSRGSSADVDGGYLLAYMLGRHERHWKAVHSIADELGLEVRLIPVFEGDLKREGCIFEPVGPREFVSLLANASFVCTDSFHGVAFSICLERDFCAFERFKRGDSLSQNSRIYNILDAMGLKERLLSEGADPRDMAKPVAWTEPRALLASKREASLAWLRDALEVDSHAERHGDNVLRGRSLCCGCSACAVACPTGAISVALDGDGFWRASVMEEKCVSCGRCRAVCPFIERAFELPVTAGTLFSYKTGDTKRLLSSSSGGAAADIAASQSALGAAVLGCIFDEVSRQAVHILVSPGDASGLASLAGSKYLQSRMFPGLTDAVLHSGPLAVFGTPCQVAAARNLMADRDDVLYVDLICHGVPTRNLYIRYVEWLSREHGIDPERVRTEFRYKPRGWRERYIYSTDGDREACLHQRRDPYFLLFEAAQCYAGCCYECPWRSASAADVRLGDYWGTRFEDDNSGVSMILALTASGVDAVRDLRKHGEMRLQPLEDYALWQKTRNNPEPLFRRRLLGLLADGSSRIEDIVAEFAEPVAREKDLRRMMDPLAGVARRVLRGDG